MTGCKPGTSRRPSGDRRGRGVAVEGGIRVTGRWGFATGSRHATWLGAHVAVCEPDGTPRLNPNGRPFMRTVLLPKSSAEIIDNWQVIGLRGTGSDSYRVEDLFVPQKYTLSRDNETERREPGLLYRFTSGMIYAMGFSNVSLGIARGALEAFIELARDKIPRGARKTLRENNVIQSEVAQCEARLRSSRAFIHTTLREMWDDAAEKGDFGRDKHWQLRLAATWAIQQARDVVAAVYNAAGATAIFNENPFERRLRDIHAGTQQGQGRPIHFETVGQILLGLPPRGACSGDRSLTRAGDLPTASEALPTSRRDHRRLLRSGRPTGAWIKSAGSRRAASCRRGGGRRSTSPRLRPGCAGRR